MIRRLAVAYLLLAVVAIIQVTQVRFTMNGNAGDLACWTDFTVADQVRCDTYAAYRLTQAPPVYEAVQTYIHQP